MADIEFVNGLRVFKPSDKAPDFIIANGEIDVEELRRSHGDGKFRIVIKESKAGKYYAAVDKFEPGQRDEPRRSAPPVDDFGDDESLPF